MPQIDQSPAGRFVAGLCDPFLNWFRRFSFTRVGMIDFSPILALGALSLGSMIFSTLASTGHITLGLVLAGLVQIIWSFRQLLPEHHDTFPRNQIDLRSRQQKRFLALLDHARPIFEPSHIIRHWDFSIAAAA